MAQLWNQVQDFRGRWGWMLALGILLVFLGLLSMLASVLATMLTTSIFGFLLLLAGVVIILHVIEARRWEGVWMNLFIGILYAVSGFYLFANPLGGAIILTLLMASVLLATGFIRVVTAVMKRFEHWGWFLASGSVSIFLGLLIWMQWPASGLYMIGLFVGIDMTIIGWALVIQALHLRQPESGPE